jgi:hypothetical protein
VRWNLGSRQCSPNWQRKFCALSPPAPETAAEKSLRARISAVVPRGTRLAAQAGIVKSGYPTHPAHPERVCWGCDRYCSADDLICGKDTVRTPHPLELFGADWNVVEPTPSPGLRHLPVFGDTPRGS